MEAGKEGVFQIDRGGGVPELLKNLIGLVVLAILLAFFFNRFLLPFLNDFWFICSPQLGTENQPKSIKNRCQDAFPC